MFTWTTADARRSRPYTCKLLDLAEQGAIDWETLARDALNWMDETEAAQFARSNDYIQNDPAEDEDDE